MAQKKQGQMTHRIIKTQKVLITALKGYQSPELKKLTQEKFSMLYNSLRDEGQKQPLIVFQWSDNPQIYVIDGHQRLKVLRKLAQDTQTKIEVVCTFINVKDEKEANELLLAFTSHYATFNKKNLLTLELSEKAKKTFSALSGIKFDPIKKPSLKLAAADIDVDTAHELLLTDFPMTHFDLPQLSKENLMTADEFLAGRKKYKSICTPVRYKRGEGDGGKKFYDDYKYVVLEYRQSALGTIPRDKIMMCYYVQDYNFMDIFLSPSTLMKWYHANKIKYSITPNFSNYWNAPFVFNLAPKFQNLYLAYHMQQSGIKIIQDIWRGRDLDWVTLGHCMETDIYAFEIKSVLMAADSGHIDKDTLYKSAQKFFKEFDKKYSPKMYVIVGGDRGYQFMDESCIPPDRFMYIDSSRVTKKDDYYSV